MYDTGIFSEFCYGEWDLNTGKWDLGKNWAGKWDWYPPSGPSLLTRWKGENVPLISPNCSSYRVL